MYPVSAPFGVDVSHRGAPASFVRVQPLARHTELWVRDFQGNFLLNTLGNLLLHPNAGLLLIDFESGDALSSSVHAELVELPSDDAGSARFLRCSLRGGSLTRAAVPLRFDPP